MKILVSHYGGLGDFLTILPVVAYYKTIHAASITLLGKPSFASLAMQAGYIDHIEDAGSAMNLFLFQENSDQKLIRGFFAPYDLIILFAVPDSPLIENTRAFSTAKIVAQPPFPEKRIPIVDYHLSAIGSMPFELSQRVPTLSLPEGEPGNPLSAILQSIQRKGIGIALHPGSGSKIKNWPFERFLAVAKRLRNESFSVCWICGPAEADIEVPTEDTLLKGLTLLEISKILRYCAAFIGNDGGITHLAAASGCPVIALFGPSDPIVWGPRGINPVKIIYHPYDCSPCHRISDKTKVCDHRCMNAIHPDEVLKVLHSLIR